MRTRGRKPLVGLLLLAAAVMLPCVAAGNPVYTIGPGADLFVNELDSGGARINVERDPVLLPAGRYAVLDFAMNTGDASGYVTPFLATGAPSIYTVVWVGDQFDPSGSGIQTDSYLPDTEEFVLASAGNVYAGFYQSNNLVRLVSNVDRTDHDNTPTEPTYVGEIVSGFSHANWPRTCAFEVNARYIPEPATLSRLALGCLGLVRRRRRRA